MRKQHELDGEIVEWIGRLGAAGAPHVVARFGITSDWAYQRLRALVKDGLLFKHRVLHDRPSLYVATRRGLTWRCPRGLRVCRMRAGSFEHRWRIADAAVAFGRGLPGWEVLSDREVLWHERERRELLASVRVGSMGGDVPALHRPDLVLLSPAGRVAAIEVELSEKRGSALVTICNGWARARHVHVVYYLASEAAARAVGRAVRETRAEDRVRILPLGQEGTVVWLEQDAAASAGGDDEHR